jgi:serine protease Do
VNPRRRRPRTLSVALATLLALAVEFGRPSSAPALSLFGEGKTESATVPTTPAGLPDFVALSKRLSPSVVNISTTMTRQPGRPGFPGRPGGPGGGDPFGEFMEPFERFFGPSPRRPFRQKSLGSGFVIDGKGLILTNNHVIEDADEVIVRLSDEKEYKAKILGRDKKTDIALLQIEGANGLSPASFGDSDTLEVGEWVMAIGNPFGLENTVTAGIVSAKSRHLGSGPYDDFIQTDASINPGNSGGPLINLHGQVVGINTAIFSRTGGNIGIGFAIPINMAKNLIPDLESKGKVVRGWLGVLIQKVTPEIADSLGLKKAEGALVADVMKDGPAKEAGIQVGDVIVEFDGKPVKDSTELPLLVARTAVNSAVDVVVLRGKGRETVKVKIAELKDDDVVAGAPASNEEMGLTVQDLTPEIAESLGLERGTGGVVVSGVEPGSPAEDAQLRRGDVILEVNRKPVKSAGEFSTAVRSTAADKSVLLLVKRGENTIFLALKPKG